MMPKAPMVVTSELKLVATCALEAINPQSR